MIKVLVVDDSALARKLFGRALSEASEFEVEFARNGIEALAQLASFQPDVVTLDIEMPQMDGLSCLDQIMIQRPCPVVMVSSLTKAGADATLEALRLGAVDFVPKPAGAVSLQIDDFAPALIAKVRAAAEAKLPASRRLRERLQFKSGAPTRAESAKVRGKEAAVGCLSGEGVVVVGTSTGGPPALEALLVPLPADFHWPIVVAQHMPANFTGPLAKRLDGICALEVMEVTKPTALRAGRVYIGRGDADVVISKRPAGLMVMPAPARSDYPWHPSTDRLVRSALQHLPASQVLGVLMTGMGNDGAEAMAALHGKGGTTIAESEETAVVWGMPGELVRAGGASVILPLPRIARRLQDLVPDAAHP